MTTVFGCGSRIIRSYRKRPLSPLVRYSRKNRVTDLKSMLSRAMEYCAGSSSEQAAADLCNSSWSSIVRDVSDTLFINYLRGSDVGQSVDYNRNEEAERN